MGTVFLQGSVTSIFVGQTGHQHLRSIAADDNVPTAINCPECEPYLLKEGAVHDKRMVPLTDRQEAAKEEATREGGLAVRQAAEALATTASRVLRQDEPNDIDARIAAAVAAALAAERAPKRRKATV
jgi:hypothetical protein